VGVVRCNEVGNGFWLRKSLRHVLLTTGVSTIAFLVLPGAAHGAQWHAKKTTSYYVSLGDSYSVGYQPQPTAGATSGFTGYVSKKEKLTLENFGCGGATTSSILNYTGQCVAAPTSSQYGPPAISGTVGPETSGDTQVQNAVAFIKSHAGQIGLITVSIGGNDVTSCANASNPITCVSGAVAAIKTNVSNLASQLRAAAGSSVPLIGLTYPDVILGDWVYPSGKTNQSLATESVTAFQSLINPALSTAYTGAGGNSAFVDVTSDTGAYTPLSQTTTLKPYGKIPKAVAEVCQLTWYCQLGNIHANTKGYTFIGGLVAKEYASIKP
jgi:lysophospholipase L1-like esterase